VLALTRGARRRYPWLTLSAMQRRPAEYQTQYLYELRLVLKALSDLVGKEIRIGNHGIAAIVIELRPGGRVHYVVRRSVADVTREIARAVGDRELTATPPRPAPIRGKKKPARRARG